MRSKDPFEWIKASQERRINRYREPKEARNPELWVSSRYDFTDPAVWKEYVPEERCTVGACVSSIIKSWTIIKLANEGRSKSEEPVEDIMIRVNRIQKSLFIKEYRFQELEAIGYYDEQEEDEARQMGWVDEDEDGPVIYSELEAQLWREQKSEEDW